MKFCARMDRPCSSQIRIRCIWLRMEYMKKAVTDSIFDFPGNANLPIGVRSAPTRQSGDWRSQGKCPSLQFCAALFFESMRHVQHAILSESRPVNLQSNRKPE